MPKIIIPSGSGEILFVTDNSASLDFRNNSNFRTGSGVIGKWEVDPDDGGSIQFRIPKEKAGTSNDRIAFYISSSGRIGIGTKDPETAFDVRDFGEDADPKDRTAKTKILKISKTSQEFDTPITASIISASNHLQTSIIKGDPTLETGLEISGFVQVTNVTASGHITASGNISASGNIIGDHFIGQEGLRLIENNSSTVTVGFQNNTPIVIGKSANPTTFADHITASGNISSSGNFIGNNIGSGIYDNRIYLTPTDFFPNGDNQSTRNDSGYIAGDGGHIIDPGRRLSYYAQKVIPKGYEATHVLLKGNNGTNVVRVYSSSFGGDTAGQAGPDGTVGTILNFTSSAIVGGTNGTYCSVKWVANALSQCYGGYIQIRPV